MKTQEEKMAAESSDDVLDHPALMITSSQKQNTHIFADGHKISMISLIPIWFLIQDSILNKKEWRLRLRYMSVQSTWYMYMKRLL